MNWLDTNWQAEFVYGLCELLDRCRLPAKLVHIEVQPAFVLRLTPSEAGLMPFAPRPSWMVQLTFVGGKCSVLVSRTDDAAEAKVVLVNGTAQATVLGVWDGALHAALAQVQSAANFIDVEVA